MTKLKWSDVQWLPTTDPKYREFERQVMEDEAKYDMVVVGNPLNDEESLEYFDRYVAGDR